MSILFLWHFIIYNKGGLTTLPHPQSFCCYTLNCSVAVSTGGTKAVLLLHPAPSSCPIPRSPQKSPFGGRALLPGVAASRRCCQVLPRTVCYPPGKKPFPGPAAQDGCSHRDGLGREDGGIGTGTAQMLSLIRRIANSQWIHQTVTWCKTGAAGQVFKCGSECFCFN